ncbi:MAG: hypothetical protein U5R46_16940 [Gammaproteobacteria bacterium]|nr:hypothetical protein [Gammaproteobacteria bacterium]
MSAKNSSLPVVLTLIAASAALFLVALPALDGPLVLDSLKLYTLEPIVAEHGSQALWHTPGFGRGIHRIVAMASFVLNVQAAGELSAFHVKLTNICIHLVAGGLVFLLTRLLLARTGYREWATGVALGTAVLWLLSPLNFNVAVYGVQRMAQLATLFTFAGLALYVAGRLQDRTRLRVLYIALAGLVCLPLAVLSKQNGILLVPLAFLVEVYFLHRVRPWLTGRQLALVAVLGVIAAVGLLFYLYPGLINYQHRDFTLAERLMSEPRALLSYLQHLAAPFGAGTGIYTDDFAASTSLFTPLSTIVALAAVLAMMVFCVACARGRLAPVAFGLAFFLVGHALESTFLPLELYFLHRNYLPGYGIYFALAALFVTSRIPRYWLIITLALYATYFTAISYTRSVTWSSDESIVSAAVYYHPESPRALSNFAQLALEKGRFDLANSAIDRSIAVSGTLKSHVQRLYIRCLEGTVPADADYRGLAGVRSFGVSNEISQALGNLLTLYERGGCPRLDVPRLVAVLDELSAERGGDRGYSWTITYYADGFLYAAGDREQAHRRLRERMEGGHLESGLYRLELLIREEEPDLARATLDRIEERFDPARLERYRGTLTEFRGQVRDMQ